LYKFGNANKKRHWTHESRAYAFGVMPSLNENELIIYETIL